MSLPPVLISSDNALWGANVRIDVSSRQIRISWPVSSNKPRVEYNFQSLLAVSNTLFRGLRLKFDDGARIYFYPTRNQFNINGQEINATQWLWEIIQENKRAHASPGGITDPQWVIRESLHSYSRDPNSQSPKYQVDHLEYGDLTPISGPNEPGAPSIGLIIGLGVFLGFCVFRGYESLIAVSGTFLAFCLGWRIVVRQVFAYLDEPNKLIRFNFPRSTSGMKSFPLSGLIKIKTIYWAACSC